MESQMPLTPYLGAVKILFDRIADAIGPRKDPVAVYLAGGAAVHWYTRGRATADVDAEFAGRVVLDEVIVEYEDESGDLQTVYLDRNYNPMFSLLHEDYQQDAIRTGDVLGGSGRLELFVLSPLDLAVSKLSRWQQVDREDVSALAAAGLLDSRALEARAMEALECAIGHGPAVPINIREAVEIVRSYGR